MRGDREFILSLCEIDGQSLSHAEPRFQNDDFVLTVAVANTARTIIDCFRSRSDEDIERVVSFSSRIYSRLEVHDTFMRVFVCGISASRPHEAPASRCKLPLLDRGIETSVAFKKSIARFAGIPVGAELACFKALR